MSESNVPINHWLGVEGGEWCLQRD